MLHRLVGEYASVRWPLPASSYVLLAPSTMGPHLFRPLHHHLFPRVLMSLISASPLALSVWSKDCPELKQKFSVFTPCFRPPPYFNFSSLNIFKVGITLHPYNLALIHLKLLSQPQINSAFLFTKFRGRTICLVFLSSASNSVTAWISQLIQS